MWAPGYADAMGTYTALLPPPPPPPPPVSEYMNQSPQFPPSSPQQFHQASSRGRGHGRGGPRTPHQPMQAQAVKMPAGLAGPWQASDRRSVPQASQAQAKPQANPTPASPEKRKHNVILSSSSQVQPKSTGPVTAASVKVQILEGLMNVKADSYPKELLEKFSPLKCDLCVAKMNSTMQAKMHYSGKQHQKKVRMYLVSLSQTTGEPLNKRAKPSEPDEVSPVLQTKVAVDPESKVQSLYCKCCDLSFTSALHAEQHYTGRNHLRVQQGQLPLKAGYFNPATGKWQRKAICDSRPPEDPTGRFGIGSEFVPEATKAEEAASVASEAPPDLKKGRFYCAMCNVGATSQDQLDMHYSGARHRKMLANKQPKPSSKQPKSSSKQTQVLVEKVLAKTMKAAITASETILSSVNSKEQSSNKGGRDLSFFRTPSGRFYCQPCNITLNSESQFMSHTESKKHKLKQASQKPAMTLTGPIAAQWGDKSTTS